jgi:hypothetical protein
MQSGGNNSPKNGVAFDNQAKLKRSNGETSNSNGSVDFCDMCWTAICPAPRFARRGTLGASFSDLVSSFASSALMDCLTSGNGSAVYWTNY